MTELEKLVLKLESDKREIEQQNMQKLNEVCKNI